MTRAEAIEVVKRIKDKCNDEFHGVRYVTDEEALDMAIKALENIGHLTDRPCDVCEFNKENGCCKWTCVFCDGLFGEIK